MVEIDNEKVLPCYRGCLRELLLWHANTVASLFLIGRAITTYSRYTTYSIESTTTKAECGPGVAYSKVRSTRV